MLVILEIVSAKILVFLQLGLCNQLDKPISDDTGGDIQFAGQIVDGDKLHGI